MDLSATLEALWHGIVFHRDCESHEEEYEFWKIEADEYEPEHYCQGCSMEKDCDECEYCFGFGCGRCPNEDVCVDYGLKIGIDNSMGEHVYEVESDDAPAGIVITDKEIRFGGLCTECFEDACRQVELVNKTIILWQNLLAELLIPDLADIASDYLLQVQYECFACRAGL